MQEILSLVILGVATVLVPVILVEVVKLLFQFIDRFNSHRLRSLAEEVVMWAEGQLSKGKKFDAAVRKLQKMTGIPREKAEILIQSAWEKLREFLESGRKMRS